MTRRRPLSDAPERLSDPARARIRAWADRHAPRVALHLGRHWAECRDWHQANGVLRADWEAAFRNWLRKALEYESRERQGESRQAAYRSRPVRQPGAPQGMPSPLSGELAEVLELFGSPPGSGRGGGTP